MVCQPDRAQTMVQKKGESGKKQGRKEGITRKKGGKREVERGGGE